MTTATFAGSTGVGNRSRLGVLLVAIAMMLVAFAPGMTPAAAATPTAEPPVDAAEEEATDDEASVDSGVETPWRRIKATDYVNVRACMTTDSKGQPICDIRYTLAPGR